MSKIIVEFPERLKNLAAAVADLVGVVEAQDGSAQCGKAVDYARVETKVGDATARIERESHAAILATLDIDRPSVLLEGKRCARAARAPGSYKTLAGEVEVERTIYRSPDGRGTFDPISVRVGAVGDGWLPRTARAMAFEVQKATSREAEKSAQQTGRLPYSRSSFECVAHEVGEVYVAAHQDVEDALIDAYEVPGEARSVSVSLDRVSVPMEEPRPRPGGRPRADAPKRPISREFRMAYCGTVTLHDREGRALHTIRYGTMPQGDAEALCEGMAADVFTLLQKNPALEVMLLCDGAPEMWNLLEKQLKPPLLEHPPERLVDMHHLIEKLGKAAKLVADDGSAQTERWKLRLLNDSDAAAQILGELVASGKEHVRSGDEEPVHDAITYLTNHAQRLDYASARARGLPIGSGNVEATCKSLFEVRFKRSGSRWKEETGEHVVHLRALALSDRWDDGVELALAPLRQAVRPAPPIRRAS